MEILSRVGILEQAGKHPNQLSPVSSSWPPSPGPLP